MSENWVVNASPLVLLAKSQCLSLLPALCQRLVIPRGVANEVNAGSAEDPARLWLHEEGHAFVEQDEPVHPSVALWNLGVGETEVLSYALRHSGYEAIVDDRAARKCARAHGLQFRGTIGLIVLAKRRGLIPAVVPVFDRLARAGLRCSPDLIERALREAEED